MKKTLLFAGACFSNFVKYFFVETCIVSTKKYFTKFAAGVDLVDGEILFI